ncbi:MAG: translocation/assembly module TamB [Bacteroidaceae bacterium]|nr:translocation/assembly module TamB [Bacteroidaceae bacterium]
MKIKKRRYIQLALCIAVLLVVGTTMLLNSPRVQQRVSVILATELENRIGTRVNLGGVHWLFPNDIVIDSLEIDDQEGEHLLSVSRIAAKVEWMPLIKQGQLSIRNIRLFNPDVIIYKNQAADDYNYQFLIDAFAAKEKKEKPAKLNLRINSLLIRHANLTHHVGDGGASRKNSANSSKRPFTVRDISVKDLSAHLSLKALTTDSISLMVRQLNFKEQSGLAIDNLYFRLVGNRHGATLANFRLDLPHSTLHLDTIWASYLPDRFSESLIVKGKVLPSQITLSDLSWLTPQIREFKERVDFTTDFIGSLSRINVKDLDIHTRHGDISLKANGIASLSGGKLDMASVNLQEAALTAQAWKLLQNELPDIHQLIPAEVTRIGAISAHGQAKLTQALSTIDLNATTDAGNFEAHVNIDQDGHYVTTLEGQDLHVAQIIPSSPLIRTNLAIEAEGIYSYWATNDTLPLRGTFSGKATQTNLLGYSYESIRFDGRYSPEAYAGDISVNDPNGSLLLQAEYKPMGKVPSYSLNLYADTLNLHALKLVDTHKGNRFSTHLSANIRGVDFNHFTGQISVDSLTLHKPTEDYIVKQIAIYGTDPDKKMISLSSDFMEGSVRGEFTYQSLFQSVVNHLHHYLPSICRDHLHQHTHTDNLCTANFKIHNTKPLEEFLLIPISIDKAINIEGFINDRTESFKLQAVAPHVQYGDINFSNLSFKCEPAENGIDCHVGGTQHGDNNVATTANFLAKAANDEINLGLLWESTPYDLFSGSFYSNVRFQFDEHDQLAITVQSDSSHTTINHSKWQLHPFKVDIASGNTAIHDFRFEHDGDQYLTIDGSIAHTPADTLQVRLNNLDLNYLLTLVKLKDISFGGNVSGYINAADLYTDTPYLDARITAEDFNFCEGPMGDALVHAYWDQDSTRLEFTADVSESLQRITRVNGYADIADNELWLDIAADSTNASFLNGLLSSFMADIKGNASGNIIIGGPMDGIDLLDGALLTDVSFKLTPTNTDYHFRDTIHFAPGHIYLRGIEAHDKRNQKAIVNGVITHDKLSDYSYELHVDAQNILGIDLPNTGSDSFYTTILGTGEVQVSGAPDRPLKVGIVAQPEKGSLFALNIVSQDVASSESFITFRDRASKRNTLTVRPNSPIRRRPASSSGDDFELDITANVTPDATLQLVMNQATNDHISVTGNGELQISIHGDDINLFGTYTVDHGGYRLSLQDVINKDFEVLQGSTVTFDGDPMSSRLNITACHTVNYVPLRDLTPDATGNVRVNCLLKIGGTLDSPQLAFDLELPQGTEEEKTILRSYTSTEEQMNMQFIYLLGVGKFYTMDLAQNQNTEGTGNMESFLSSTISGQINNLLSSIINSDNWNFASNIRTENMMGVTDNPMANMEVQGILEGRLLDNRLLINGNFGYRDNPMYASNFIGDFDIRYLLRNGLSLKGYNKTNDRYFTKTSLTTQGIGLLFQRDFNYLFPRRKKVLKAIPEVRAEE